MIYVILVYLVSFIFIVSLYKIDIWLKLEAINHEHFKDWTYGDAIATIILLPVFCIFTMYHLFNPIMEYIYNKTFLSKNIFK